MVHTRGARRSELSESWDDVDSDEESRQECGNDTSSDSDERRTRRNTRQNRREVDGPDVRKRVTRSSVGPQFIMPASPNAMSGTQRPKTPHFRLNERSTTSDAGDFDAARKAKMSRRAQTPHLRMSERSMTSDAGRFKVAAAASDDFGNDPERSAADHLRTAWDNVLSPVLRYFFDVVGMTLNNMKPLIAYGLFAYLIVAAMIFGSGFINNSIHHALSPICRIPGVTQFFRPPFCPSTPPLAVAHGAAEFDKLMQAQLTFDDVLAASSTGASLPMDMKRSEASIRDLKHVVAYSTLPSRNELVFEFGGFIETARQASQDLSKFNSRIGRAVDQILSTNRWTLNVISGVSEDEARRGSLSRVLNDYLNVFAPFQPVQLSRDILLDQYLRHTSAVEEQIAKLITEAHALLAVLENLDARLDVISEITKRDGLKTEENRDELFELLWTKLGGNRSSVNRLEKQIQLLNDVTQYKRRAWAHVSTTMVKLQSIRDQLEDLREQVAKPETVGVNRTPLEIHINSINLGIERLEEQRNANRRAEADGYARVISRAEAGNAKMVGDGES